jgi:hypothetical protein
VLAKKPLQLAVQQRLPQRLARWIGETERNEKARIVLRFQNLVRFAAIVIPHWVAGIPVCRWIEVCHDASPQTRQHKRRTACWRN